MVAKLPSVLIGNVIRTKHIDMRKFRFGIRTALLLVTIAAGAFFAVLQYHRYLERERLSQMRAAFVQWAGRINRADGKIHTYAMLNRDFDNNALPTSPIRRPFLVANAEMRLVMQSDGQTMIVFDPRRKPPDPHRFYTLPAGRWVSDVDSVLEEWDRWRNIEFRNGGQPSDERRVAD